MVIMVIVIVSVASKSVLGMENEKLALKISRTW
jgi:hypothetical protein